MSDKKIIRCFWADETSQLYLDYHDKEWGIPVHDDKKLFEMLMLESFQAGLSWITILKKREAFREAFDGFDPEKVACYQSAKVEELMQNAAIVRNRRKIEATVKNAGIFLDIRKEKGSFDSYLWAFTDGRVIQNQGEPMPVSTELSDRISKDLYRRGMRFVGTVIIYSYLQAVGVVDDHEPGCFCCSRRKKKS